MCFLSGGFQFPGAGTLFFPSGRGTFGRALSSPMLFLARHLLLLPIGRDVQASSLLFCFFVSIHRLTKGIDSGRVPNIPLRFWLGIPSALWGRPCDSFFPSFVVRDFFYLRASLSFLSPSLSFSPPLVFFSITLRSVLVLFFFRDGASIRLPPDG